MNNQIISLVPLSYNSSEKEIRGLLSQISLFSNLIEIIVILEKNDLLGYKRWEKYLSHERFSNFYLGFVESKGSKGLCLNEAIKKSKGEFIMRCDMDDVICQNRFRDTIEIINNNIGQCDFIYSDMIDLDKNKILKYPNPSFAPLISIFKNPFPAPTVCFRKSFFENNSISYPAYNRSEDLSLSLAFIDKKAKIHKLETPVVKYKNNNLNRDYQNWFNNFLIRLKRNRFDLIGLFSLLSGFLFLFISWILFLKKS